MPRLKVKELAEDRGYNMSRLQRESGVTMPSVRRYWYNTRTGKTEGEPLKEVDLGVLAAIAKVLGVKSRDLLSDEDRTTLLFATGDQASANSRAERGEANVTVPAVSVLHP